MTTVEVSGKRKEQFSKYQLTVEICWKKLEFWANLISQLEAPK